MAWTVACSKAPSTSTAPPPKELIDPRDCDTYYERSYKESPPVKFDAKHKFEDFYVGPILGKAVAPIDSSSHVLAKRYKTVISREVKEGINFAGFYRFVSWGCGSNCFESAIVDLRNGKVYEGPTSSCGYEVKVQSRMIYAPPADEGGYWDGSAPCQPRIYVWNEETKKVEPLQ